MSIESKAETSPGITREKVRELAKSIISEFGQSFSQVTSPLRATGKVYCLEGTYHWLSEGDSPNLNSEKVIYVERKSKDIDRCSRLNYIISPDEIIGYYGKEVPDSDLFIVLNDLRVIERALHKRFPSNKK